MAEVLAVLCLGAFLLSSDVHTVTKTKLSIPSDIHGKIEMS